MLVTQSVITILTIPE